MTHRSCASHDSLAVSLCRSTSICLLLNHARGIRSTTRQHARGDPIARPLQNRTHHHFAAGREDRDRRRPAGAQYVREQLSRARRSSGAHRRGERSARYPRLRDGVGPFHLRHPGHSQGSGRRADAISSEPKTQFFTRPRSTPTAVCSKRCSVRRTRLFPTN